MITVFNGEHYKVKGDNKKTVKRGESVEYEIALDEGYELVSSFGAECAIPSFKETYSFNQSVIFPTVNYNTAVTFSVKELEVTDFTVSSNIDECEVEIDSVAGLPNDKELYVVDQISLYAVPAEGYRFHCWSTGNYLSAGGTYFSKERILNEFDFHSTSALYANFKSTADSARTIVYDFGEGVEIEQDCSPIVAHHYLANTFTEPDLKENGYELPEDKMLVGWNTESGEYVGLGSRTAVSEETFITLTPVWKQYADENDFIFSDGKITDYVGESKEVVIPKTIGGEEVTVIAANAFEESEAETYYITNSITSIEENAFLNCTALKTFYMSDNITQISDESFRGCKNFQTLHLNAYLKPRYAKDFSSLKGNICDKLILDKNEKKCVLLGGSSVSYGYNVELGEELLGGQYSVYNLGYNRDMCVYAVLDVIDGYITEGDVFVHNPEQNSNSWCSSLYYSVINEDIASLWFTNFLLEIFECNWQLISNLEINRYSQLFNWFSRFNNARQTAPPQEYFDYCRVVPNGKPDGRTIAGENVRYECGKAGYVFGLNGNLRLFTDDWYIELADTNIYEPLMKKGVNVYVTFVPTNRSNLYITYNNEDNLKIAADKYTQNIKDLVSDGVHVLLTQYDTIYDSELFCDTDWHLGYPTRDVHTRKVMNALIEELKKNGGIV